MIVDTDPNRAGSADAELYNKRGHQFSAESTLQTSEFHMVLLWFPWLRKCTKHLVMVWGCLLGAGLDLLVPVKGTFNASVYQDIL